MRYIVNLLFVAVLASSGAFLFSADVKAQNFCSATIFVDTIPGSDTDFPYTVTGEFPEEFTINPVQARKIGASDITTVTQGDVAGWVLRDIDCENINNMNITKVGSGISFECLQNGGFASCTFINSQTEAIPTISQWGLVALVLGLGAVGYFVIRRRQVSA